MMKFFTSVPGIILSVAGSLAILAVAYGYFKRLVSKDDRQEKTEIATTSKTITDFWQDQAEKLQVILDKERTINKQTIDEIKKELGLEITKLTREVGEVRGQLNSEQSSKKEYLAILQGRDPETKEFMKLMLDFAKDQRESNEKQTIINAETTRVLGDIHTMVKAEQDRELHVDTTITKN